MFTGSTIEGIPMSVHFSKKSDEWATPQDLFDELNRVFKFTLDAAASSRNAKVNRYFSKRDDALKQSWEGETVWLNPPYSQVADFMRKAYVESQNGAAIVALVPARTDTRWWHDYARKGQIVYLRGRLKFGGSPNSAPFPSAVVIFYPGKLGQAVGGTHELAVLFS